ncbi:unnamed protein product, partial [Amoebophrya sp. A25]|eukprot:GSA25T00013781001.1
MTVERSFCAVFLLAVAVLLRCYTVNAFEVEPSQNKRTFLHAWEFKYLGDHSAYSPTTKARRTGPVSDSGVNLADGFEDEEFLRTVLRTR